LHWLTLEAANLEARLIKSAVGGHDEQSFTSEDVVSEIAVLAREFDAIDLTVSKASSSFSMFSDNLF
jgi:hypothetical protein